ncbi:hypothetical protein BGW38_006435 [Lunasporangiospora selenospora]|uniref:Uncharacterized protein n=1 Tax=Lunasporangiospora selenospora TaxID=979761 RepID=A0A9P6FMW1_9FUNG|nr:hypothetical protein BGW38_006435 [Lunasporangiospora selenospora]
MALTFLVSTDLGEDRGPAPPQRRTPNEKQAARHAAQKLKIPSTITITSQLLGETMGSRNLSQMRQDLLATKKHLHVKEAIESISTCDVSMTTLHQRV